MKTNLLSFLFIFLCTQAFSQTPDSLWNIWEDESQTDSVRLTALHNHAWNYYLFAQPDSAGYFMDLQYEYAKKKKETFFMADAKNVKGITWYFRGELDSAIVEYEESAKLYQSIDHKRGLSRTVMNLGSAYLYQGNIAKTIQNYTYSLQLNELMDDSLGQAQCLTNIGTVYLNQREYEVAAEYYRRSIAIYEHTADKVNLANSINNLGITYFERADYEPAMKYYLEALELRKKYNDLNGIAASTSNIGMLELERGNHDIAEQNLLEAYGLFKELSDPHGEATVLVGLGKVYSRIGQKSTAIGYLKDALELSQKFGMVKEIQDAAEELYIIQKKSNPAEALRMYELHIQMRDSLSSEENNSEIINQQYKYEYEKQATADSIQNIEREKLVAAQLETERAEKKAQRQQNYVLWIGLGIALLFGFFAFNRFQVTNKQKVIIEEQKEKVDFAFAVLEEKSQEILDSINYAKRIQNAILPTDASFKSALPNSFVYYQPKDIVAGDFYWMHEVEASGAEEAAVFFAAADCTGHGVPGAMVSVVCNNGLNRSVREHNLRAPGAILDKTREIVITEFEKSEEEVKDGMDIALCVIKGKTLQYAGAHNPLWIVRDKELIEIKANKQPIGNFAHPTPYETHSLELQPNDTIYVFTDGYADQFGGDKGKKLKVSNFKKLILSIQELDMATQKTRIEQEFENWRGSLEQIDDICVIGVRV